MIHSVVDIGRQKVDKNFSVLSTAEMAYFQGFLYFFFKGEQVTFKNKNILKITLCNAHKKTYRDFAEKNFFVY